MNFTNQNNQTPELATAKAQEWLDAEKAKQ